MKEREKCFPENFLWGASTSAFQAEGGAGEGGKGLATTDLNRHEIGIASTKTASDHYHHWKEDIDLMAELGLKVYRMSFSWSRIMPGESEEPNKKGLEFYDEIINYLLDKKIEPFVTLYHFECPQALVDAFGGWKSRKMIDAYLNYAKICFTHFKGRVKRWATINEQLVASMAPDLTGDKETDGWKRQKNAYQMSYNMSLAEHKAFLLLKEIDADAEIGPVCAIQVVYPLTCASGDVLAAWKAEELMEFSYLDMSVRGEYSPYAADFLHREGLFPDIYAEDNNILKSSTPDFIGVNYYCSSCAAQRSEAICYDGFPPWTAGEYLCCDNPHAQKTKWMMNIDPLGLQMGIRKIYARYHLPVIIAENGMASSEELGADEKIHDKYRISYLAEHIAQLKVLIDEGYPIVGYCSWSFLDLVSSHQGFAKRYGLVFVDRTETDVKEYRRIKKDSFYWYQNVIKQNGLTG